MVGAGTMLEGEGYFWDLRMLPSKPITFELRPPEVAIPNNDCFSMCVGVWLFWDPEGIGFCLSIWCRASLVRRCIRRISGVSGKFCPSCAASARLTIGWWKAGPPAASKSCCRLRGPIGGPRACCDRAVAFLLRMMH